MISQPLQGPTISHAHPDLAVAEGDHRLKRGRAFPCRIALLGSLVLAGLLEAVLVYGWDPGFKAKLALHVAYVIVTGAAILILGRQNKPPVADRRWAPWAILGGGFLLSVVLAQFPMEAFPNSGDENGYTYLADTLLQGRFWNPPHPEALRDVLQTFYIADRDGKRVCQYPPGWPLVLALFKLAGVPQLCNAFVGALAGIFLWLALKRTRAAPNLRLALFSLGTLAPFTLFNNASFYNHSLTAAALLAILWLDLRDVDEPSVWNRMGIGLGFSVLLTTRYETFLIALGFFVLDGLVRKRSRFVASVLPVAVGALPLTALLLFYDWRVTGSPFTLTLVWASPKHTYVGLNPGNNGQPMPLGSLQNTAGWLASWQDFASILLLPLYAAALWIRATSRSFRWFDFLFPALVLLFFFHPDNGGFQYGPRYWYFGHAAMPVTIAAARPVAQWQWTRWRLDPLRVAGAQVASFAGFTLGYALFLHAQADVRRLPIAAAATLPTGSVLLVADEKGPYFRWGKGEHWLAAKDYTRNGVGELGPVVVARDLGEARTALLCRQMPDYKIYRLRLDMLAAKTALEPVCNGAG